MRLGRVLSTTILVATVALCCGGCRESGSSTEKEAIEKALSDDLGTAGIPIGTASLSDQEMVVVHAAQSAGLLDVRVIRSRPQATAVELKPTPKLTRLANPDDAVPVDRAGLRVLFLRISECRVDKITSDDLYKGPLASFPLGRYRLVLGTYMDIPTKTAAQVGPALATQTAQQRRFRCVLKYDVLAATWKAVAFDTGLMNSTTWRSSNVR